MNPAYNQDDLIEKVRSSMSSYGTPPFTITSLGLNKPQCMQLQELGHATQFLVVATYTDYQITDLDDYLYYHKEFGSVSTSVKRSLIADISRRMEEPELLKAWQQHQADIALDMLLHSADHIGISLTLLSERNVAEIRNVIPSSNKIDIHSILSY